VMNFRTSGDHTNTDVTQLLEALARRQPAAPALHAQGRPTLTYADLGVQIRYVREQLGSWGVVRGDFVAGVIPSRPEMAMACATLPAAATFAPLSPELTTATDWTRLSCHRFSGDRGAPAARRHWLHSHSTCPVLHSSAGRKPVDSASVSADHAPPRAARVASDVIESDGPLLGARLATQAGVSRTRGGSVGKPVGLARSTAWVSRTVPVTEHEWPDRVVKRHVVPSAAREGRERGPYRKSRTNALQGSRDARGHGANDRDPALGKDGRYRNAGGRCRS
jgi:hypothetical protein